MRQYTNLILFPIVFILMIMSCCSRFDSNEADTKNNKKQLKKYLNVDLTEDIKEIYCFGDFLGADFTVLFSFTCDSITVQRIIEKNNLTLTDKDSDNAFSSNYNFEWWDKEKITQIRAYKNVEDYHLQQYLWYDKDVKRAYYQKFSM